MAPRKWPGYSARLCARGPGAEPTPALRAGGNFPLCPAPRAFARSLGGPAPAHCPRNGGSLPPPRGIPHLQAGRSLGVRPHLSHGALNSSSLDGVPHPSPRAPPSRRLSRPPTDVRLGGCGRPALSSSSAAGVCLAEAGAVEGAQAPYPRTSEARRAERSCRRTAPPAASGRQGAAAALARRPGRQAAAVHPGTPPTAPGFAGPPRGLGVTLVRT